MFERDFTLKKYQELCETSKESGYSFLRVKDYLSNSGGNCIILRHDVDRRPKSALKMAELESKLGICSTYYFRINNQVLIPEIIKAIEYLGHEIGYHYEVLDRTNGNREKALELFQKELEELRRHAEIKTIAMHGNPLTPWTAKNLWEEHNFHEFGITGDSSISINYNTVLYLGDVGRTWDGRYSVKDLLVRDKSRRFRKTDDIIRAIKTRGISNACLVVHPNRWNDDMGRWVLEYVGQTIKNIGKKGIIHYRNFTNGSKG
jgi:hypothetical protein